MNTDADDFEEAAWELLGEAADADDGDAMIVLAELAQAAQEDADRCRRRDRRLFEAAEDAANQRAAQKEAAGHSRLVREFREREEAERLAASKRRREVEQRQRDVDARDAAAKELADRSAAADARAKRRAAELAEDEAATNAARKRRIDEERRAEEATGRREAEERRFGEVEAKARAAAQPARHQGQRTDGPRPELHSPRGSGSARPLEEPVRAAQQPPKAAPETGTATRDALRVLSAPVVAATAGGGAVPELTGADVLAYRKGRGLTQTQLASEWSVTQGTIAKAEGVPSKALGPSLQGKPPGNPMHPASPVPRKRRGNLPFALILLDADFSCRRGVSRGRIWPAWRALKIRRAAQPVSLSRSSGRRSVAGSPARLALDRSRFAPSATGLAAALGPPRR